MLQAPKPCIGAHIVGDGSNSDDPGSSGPLGHSNFSNRRSAAHTSRGTFEAA